MRLKDICLFIVSSLKEGKKTHLSIASSVNNTADCFSGWILNIDICRVSLETVSNGNKGSISSHCDRDNKLWELNKWNDGSATNHIVEVNLFSHHTTSIR